MMFYNILPETVERPKRRLLFQWTHFLIRDNIAGDKDVYLKIVSIEIIFFWANETKTKRDNTAGEPVMN